MSHDAFDIIAAGRITCPGGVPGWVWQNGFTGVPANTGVGDYDVTLDGGGAAATECCVLVTVGEAQADNRAISVSVVHTSATAKKITIVQETVAGGGGASARYDGAVEIAVIRVVAV
jgi:hypothetical protein